MPSPCFNYRNGKEYRCCRTGIHLTDQMQQSQNDGYQGVLSRRNKKGAGFKGALAHCFGRSR